MGDPVSIDFYEKIKAHALARGLTIDGYFRGLFGDKGRETFYGWKRRKLLPRADQAMAIAQDMGITIEELIGGAAGLEYVRGVVRRAGLVWEPPDNIADIVQGLGRLDAGELGIIRAAVAAGGMGKALGV